MRTVRKPNFSLSMYHVNITTLHLTHTDPNNAADWAVEWNGIAVLNF